MRCHGYACRRCQLGPQSSDNESKYETLQKFKTISKNQEDVRLKDNKVCRGFKLEIRNRFQQLSGDENDISKNWTKVKKIRNETTEKILNLRTRKHKDRLNTETYKAVDERGKLKEEIGRSN